MPVTLSQWNARKNRGLMKRLWPTFDRFLDDLICFLLGSVGAFSIHAVGSLPFCEVLVALLFPFLLRAHAKRAFRREYLWFYVLCLGWLAGTIFSDVYNNTPLDSRLKGIARVVFFGLDFLVLAIVINKKKRAVIAFSLGMSVFMMLAARQFAGDFLTEWKYGACVAFAIPMLLLASYLYSRKRYSLCVAIFLLLAALNLKYAVRSQLGAVLVAGLLTLPLLQQGKDEKKGFRLLKSGAMLILASSGAFLAHSAVKYGLSHQFFDEDVSAKFESQESGSYGVLLGGRPETLVAIQAIRDRPIIGHGSYPVDPKYSAMLADFELENGYGGSGEPSEEDADVIPTHSHLTMAWVESGILGGALFIYLIALTIRALLEVGYLRHPLTPLYAYFFITFGWDIMYSPMGSVNRIYGAFFTLLAYSVMSENQPARAYSPAPLDSLGWRRRRLLPRQAFAGIRKTGWSRN